MKKLYFDHIAATPLLPEVREAMAPFLSDEFGNPQSRHAYGKAPREAMERAREVLARLIHTEPGELFFTASGSESNNLAIKGVAQAYARRGKHIVSSVIEHPSVTNPLRTLEREGYSVTWVPVDASGRVDPAAVERAIRKETILVSVMSANNEMGTIEPIKEIARITRDHEVPFHTDAVASVGMIPVDVESLGVDLLSLAAPTFCGPKGAAALFVRRGTRIHPLIEGGIQEEGRRSGTENVPAVAGMGVAAALAERDLSARMGHLTRLRDRLREGLGALTHVLLTGDPERRLPHIVSLCAEFVDGEALIRALEEEGVYAASGSSCTSFALKISPVLTAMGVPPNVAQGGVIFSLGIENKTEEVEALLEIFPRCLDRLRAVSPVYAEVRSREVNR
jgi:cysteine desulfurase